MSLRKSLLAKMGALVGAAGIACAVPLADAQTPTQETCDVPFVGKASGGTLVICENLGRNCKLVIVETTAGEGADSVAERLAQAIKEQNPFMWLGSVDGRIAPLPGGSERIRVSASAGSLKGIIGGCPQYMTAGTEVGLGIPAPPSSLTSS